MASNAFNITGRLNIQQGNLQQMAARIHKTLSTAGAVSIPVKSPGLDAVNKQLATLKQNLAGLRGAAANIGSITPQLNNVGRAANAASKSTKTFGDSILGTTKSLAGFSVAAAGFLGTLSAIQNGLKEGIAWDKEFTRIGVVAGKSSSQLRDLKNEVHRLSTGLGVSSKGLTDASMTLTQAGLSAEKVKTSLRALALTDLAPTFDNIRNTVEGSISLFGAFGVSADKLENALSSINSVSAKYAIESSDIVSATRKAGSSFKMAGGTLSEFIGLLTSVRSTTRASANEIATGFRTIFSRLQRPGTIRRLKEMLNVDLAEGGRFVGPMKAIERLHNALNDLPQGSLLFAKASEEIGGSRRIAQVVPLIKEYKLAVEAAAVAEKGQNSLARDSVAAQASLANQIQKTTESWNKFWHTLGESKELRLVATSLLSISRAAASVSESLIPLLPAITAAASIKLGGSLFGAARKAIGHAQGGYISQGVKGVDTVPALLSKNEYVLNSRAVDRIGKNNLDAINFGNAKRFNKGGIVSPSGSVATYRIADASVKDFASALRQAINTIHDEVRSVRSERSGTDRLGKGKGYPLAADSPSTFMPGSRNYRRMRRADRIARIVDRGRGGSLVHFAQSGQQAYFDRIGYAPRPSLARRAGRLAGGTSSFLQRNANAIRNVSVVGTLGASYALSQIGGSAGTVGNGALSGAATGMMLGGVAGPMGAAVGGVVGGLTGLVSSLDSVKRELADNAIEAGLNSIGSAVGELDKALQSGSTAKARVALQNVTHNQNLMEATLGQHAAAKATAGPWEKAQGFGLKALSLINVGGVFGSVGGWNEEKQREEQARKNLAFSQSRQAGLAASRPGEDQFLNERMRNSRSFLDLRSDPAFQTILQNRVKARVDENVISRGGNVSEQNKLDLTARYTKEELAKLQADKESIDVVRQNRSAIDAFNRTAKLATGRIDQFNSRMADVATASEGRQNRVALATSMFGNSPTSIASTDLSQNVARFGSAGFEQSVAKIGRLAPETAAGGNLLIGANRAHGILQSGLPALLQGNDIGTDAGFANLKQGMTAHLQRGGVPAEVQQHILKQLNDMRESPDFANTFGSGLNNNKLANALLSWANEIQDAEEKAAKGIEAHGKDLRDIFGSWANLRNQAGESRDAAGNLQLQFLQMRERFGGGRTSLAQEQAPFLATQSRLTGLPQNQATQTGLILQRAMGLLAKRDEAFQKAKESEFSNPELVQNWREFDRLLQNSTQALRNLTNVAERNAALEKRHSKLQSDKEARTGFAENYIRMGPGERAEVGRGAMLLVKAVNKGLDSLRDAEKKTLMDFLDKTANVRLLNSNHVGSEFKERLVQNSAIGRRFAPTARDAAEKQRLEGRMLGNAQNAVMAQNAQAVLADAMAGRVAAAGGRPDVQQAPLARFPAAVGEAPLAEPGRAPWQKETPFERRERQEDERIAAGKAKAKARVDRQNNAFKLRGEIGKLQEALPFAEDDRKDLLRQQIRDKRMEIKGLAGNRNQMPGAGMRAAAFQFGKKMRRLNYDIGKEMRKPNPNQDRVRSLIEKAGIGPKKKNIEKLFPEDKGAGGGPMAAAAPEMGRLSEVLTHFNHAAPTLAEAIKGMPHTITFEGRVTHEHIFNGAEAIAQAMPEFTKQIEEKAKQATVAALQKHLPDAGPFT